MTQALDAIFEDGVFKPLTAPQISEHQKVHLVIEVPTNGARPADATGQLVQTLREISRPLGGKPWKQRGELYER